MWDIAPAGLTPAIVSLAWKGSLLLAAAGLAQVLLRRHISAAQRHLIWTTALVSLLALPIVSLVAPTWQTRIAPDAAAWMPSEKAASSPLAGAAMPSAEAGAGETSAAVLAETLPQHESVHSTGAEPTAAVLAGAASTAVSSSWLLAWPAVLAMTWLFGCLFVLARVALSHLLAAAVTSRARPVEDERTLKLLYDVILDTGLRRPVELRETAALRVPCTWGLREPVVLLPTEARGWSDERMKLVLAHEVGHIRRGDWVTQLLAGLACSVHWFNPLAWHARRSALREQEAATDDIVLALGNQPREYASNLLDIARIGHGQAMTGLNAATIAMSRRSTLEGRLLAILDANLPRTAVFRRSVGSSIVMATVMLLPLAAMQPVPHEREAPSNQPVMASPDPGAEVPVLASQATTTLIPSPLREPSEGVRAVDRSAPGKKALEKKGRTGTRSAARSPSDTTKVQALLGVLANEPDADVRESIVRILGEMADVAAVSGLTRVLSADEAAGVRAYAAWALGEIEEASAVPALSRALADDGATEVRRYAAWALGEIHDPAAVPALERSLSDGEAEVRRYAAWALAEIGGASSVPALVRAASDEDPQVRRASIHALGEIEDERAVDVLVGSLSDDDAEVRAMAAWSLGEIESVRSESALMAALRDEDSRVRRYAARALGEMGANGAADALLNMLKTDADREVRKAAAAALSELDF